MKSPLVSCIITSYNAKDDVAVAIESVLNQSYEHIELIIVDDCSTDGTEQVVRPFLDDPRVSFIEHERNSGLPAISRNTGLNHVTGEYIAFLDADDYWESNKLEIQLIEFEDPAIIAVSSRANHFGDTTMVKNVQWTDSATLSFDDFLKGNSVYLSSLIVRNDGSRFDTSFDLRFVEDRDFLMSLTYGKAGKIMVVYNKLINYQLHGLGGSRIIENQLNSLNIISKYQSKIEEFQIKTFRFYVFIRVLTECVKSEVIQMPQFVRESKKNAQGLKQKALVLAFQVIFILPLSFRKLALKIFLR